MKHKLTRSVLAVLLAAVAVFDIARGVLVLAGIRAPAVQYQDTLFGDATIPMLLLAIVVGGGSLLAAATVLGRSASSRR
jgi:uncharacterized membrane protein YphA (DoxX/SURF4 family)